MADAKLDMPRVVACAVARPLSEARVPTWAVHVWGQPPFEHHRHYRLLAADEDKAAMAGIGLYVEEVEQLWIEQNRHGAPHKPNGDPYQRLREAIAARKAGPTGIAGGIDAPDA